MMVGHDNMKKAFFLLSAFFSIGYSLQLLGALQNQFFLPKHNLYCQLSLCFSLPLVVIFRTAFMRMGSKNWI